MSAGAVQGLGCPRCGGMVTVPEGQSLVICPYCDQRSVVSAEGSGSGAPGIRRYQVPLRTTREGIEGLLRGFLSGKVQIARDCAVKAQVSEVFLVHLPFWAVWARGVAWAFGQERVGSGENKHYEPREKRAVSELSWNAPACEVGEFGVQRVSLEGRPLEPFDPTGLHRSGMVFEPVGSVSGALEAARAQFGQEIKSSVNLDRTEQMFVRLTNPRQGLVYYPLWVLRYQYHGRAFQVVIDGFNGEILYGKAPGSVGYRAGMLVGGMALGSFLAIDVPSLVLLTAGSSDDDFPLVVVLGAFALGAGMMFTAYRTFRHNEHYEFHRYKATGKSSKGGVEGLLGEISLDSPGAKDIVRTLEKFT
jgi:hypothetical protein